ncbi:MAG: universal stress protein [Pirellulales bacterium]
MKIQKIIFPTDFSHASDAAMAFASSLARDTGAKMLIVHVEEPPTAYGGGNLYYGVPEPERDALMEMLERLKPTTDDVPYEHRLLSGDPARQVIELAEQEKAGLIVMGTHGRTGILRLLMGSVAEEIVRRSSCPVVTFKAPEAANESD